MWRPALMAAAILLTAEAAHPLRFLGLLAAAVPRVQQALVGMAAAASKGSNKSFLVGMAQTRSRLVGEVAAVAAVWCTSTQAVAALVAAAVRTPQQVIAKLVFLVAAHQ